MIYVTHDQTEAMTLGQRIVVMKDGVVQQVAPPLELYERPLNAFVAGFIGSPAMNFVAGRLVRQDGLAFVPAADARPLPLPRGFTPPAAALERNVVLGVRPEHVDAGGTGATAFPAPVQVVETLGNETLLYFDLAGGTFVVRTAGLSAPAVGQSLSLALRPEHIHLFADDETGRALT
jgi:multiple sugar transport system ATP-binding protein